MELIQEWPMSKSVFVFDLEFIGDVRNLKTCKIWEIAIYSLSTQQWFEAVIDPDPNAQTFPDPPIPEIPKLERQFLNDTMAQTWDVVFEQIKHWVKLQSMGAWPVFISHNTFRADKPIMELECKRYKKLLPTNWYFFDSLHFSRRVLKNSSGNYSLSGLHQLLLNSAIPNAHRARADVVACIKIMTKITDGTWKLEGPIYPAYATALRTIRWIGQKAEEILYSKNIRSVESLYTIILENSRKYAQMSATGQQYFEICAMETLNNIIGTNLPPDNIRNIAHVIAESPNMLSYTFMSCSI